MKKAFILTEGGSSIGFGHITRCLSLYQALKEKDIDVEMLIYGDDIASILLNNIKYRIFNWIDDSELLKSLIGKPDLLIIDSTIAPADILTGYIQHTKVIAFIDDSRRVVCDAANAVIIDWTPFVEKLYGNVQDRQCAYLLGCPYISLRKSFWDVPDKIINDTISEVLITMGGGDIRNISPKILQLLINELDPAVKKSVIIGLGFSKETISLLNNFSENAIQLVYFPDEMGMVDLFSNADIIISGGGQTLYELARIGVPTIAIEVIDNQRFDIEGWQDAGFIDYAGNWEDDSTYENLIASLHKLEDPGTRQQKKEKGILNVDGQGARRIISYLINKID